MCSCIFKRFLINIAMLCWRERINSSIIAVKKRHRNLVKCYKVVLCASKHLLTTYHDMLHAAANF